VSEQPSLQPLYGLNLSRPVDELWPGFSMKEIPFRHSYWISSPADALDALTKAVRTRFGCILPERGQFSAGSDETGEQLIAAVGLRQWFTVTPTELRENELIASVSIIEQTDGWVGMRLFGQATRQVLEKLCQLDLHPAAFPTGSAARSPLEGMLSLILCEDAATPGYLLYFQRSSARSMVDHIRHAAYSACGDKSDAGAAAG
jgi:methylglutamate dehydrogenase subunit D